MLPGYKISKSDVFKLGNKVPVYGSRSGPYYVTVSKVNGSEAETTDIQGNVARTVRSFGSGNHVVHVIDEVLFSGASTRAEAAHAKLTAGGCMQRRLAPPTTRVHVVYTAAPAACLATSPWFAQATTLPRSLICSSSSAASCRPPRQPSRTPAWVQC